MIQVDKDKLIKELSHEFAKSHLISIGYIESESDMFNADGTYKESVKDEVDLSGYRLSKIVENCEIKTVSTALTSGEYYYVKKFLKLRSESGGHEAMQFLLKLGQRKNLESYERVREHLKFNHNVKFM